MAEGDVSAILKSDDVTRTIEWYRRMGFEIHSVFPESGEPSWCEVARDGVILQFLGGDTPWPGPPSFTGTLYFRPESVDALYEQIKDHTTPAWGPEVREWGTRELGVQDPDGYFLTFTERPRRVYGFRRSSDRRCGPKRLTDSLHVNFVRQRIATSGSSEIDSGDPCIGPSR